MRAGNSLTIDVWLSARGVALGCLAGWLLLIGSAFPEVSPDAVRFRSFGVNHGLSQVTARALAEDAQGFIWVGTQDGLNRFDGYEFKSYFHRREQKYSISDNHVTQLLWDPDGALWVGTLAGGINRFEPRTEHAERFAGEQGLKPGEVHGLRFDSDQRLWAVVANQPPLVLNREKARFEVISALDLGPGVRWRALLAMPEGGMLLGGSHGLWYAQHSGVARELISAPKLGEFDVSALARTPQGDLLVGFLGGGVKRFSMEGELIESFLRHPNNPGTLPDNMVRDLLVSSRGEVWVGTQRGLAYFDQRSNQFLNWFHDGGDAGSIAANRVARVMEDSNGLLWFGTWTGGISVHDPQTRALKIVRHQNGREDGLPGNPIRAIWRDNDGTFWLGIMDGGGLVHYHLQDGVLMHYQNDPFDQRSLPHNQVQSILRRRDGSLWVATLGGLAVLRDNGFEVYRRASDEQGSGLHSNSLTSLAEDDEQRLWIASDDAGVAVLCFTCDRFERVLDGKDGRAQLPVAAVNTVRTASLGRMMIGTAGGGLVQYHHATGVMRTFQHDPDDPDSISHNAVTSIDPSVRGGYWIGTQGGGINYMYLDIETDAYRFLRMDKSRGLSADAVGSVIEDRRGHAWIATTVGISEYDPDIDALRNLTAGDGLDRAGYFINSYAKGEDGTLYFGGLNGMVVFHPNELRSISRLRVTRLADFRLFNRAMLARDVDPRSPLSESPSHVRSLDFRHAQDMWTVVLTALNFTAPETTRFSYQLEGYDSGWISGRGRVATYSKVPPGRYLFRARASTDDGLNYGPELSIPVVIQPAPWLSIWAKLAYIVTVGLLVYAWVWRSRSRTAERAAAERALKQSQERLQMALWGSRDELWDIELPSGNVVRENALPQVQADPVYNVRMQDYFLKYMHPDDLEDAREALHRHLRGETQDFECIYRTRGTERDWVWILGRGRAVARDATGRVLRIVGTNRDISELKDAEQRLIDLNEQLEHRVERRTEALQQANQRLERTLSTLTETQKRLVETEKMASLGNLVAGIAHEINTPVGIGVTAASHLHEQSVRLSQRIARGELAKSHLLSFAELAEESTRLVLHNLERASHLIRSFKQVAVDQSSEQKRRISLRAYLEEVLFALQPQLKRTPHRVLPLQGEDIAVETYPGALYQIFANLINNSLIHGFADGSSGSISIAWTQTESGLELRYRDDGVGMPSEVARRVFEPFYTTKRGQGGSGLGMHITYNLVTQLLGGTIELQTEPGKGVCFLMTFPWF